MMHSFFKGHNTFIKITGLLLLIFAAVAFCCFLPGLFDVTGNVTFYEKEIALSGGEKLVLKDKSAIVLSSDGEEMFRTESDWMVQDVIAGDMDNDGRQDILFLLWKKGRFGHYRPFWIDEDEDTLSQHLFIYNIKEDGKMHQKWCASDVGAVIYRMKFMEDKPHYLLTEGKDGVCKVWTFRGFGMEEVDSEVNFIAFGDNIIHERIIEYANTHEEGRYDFLYKDAHKEVQNADIAALQQESLLVDKGSAIAGYPYFGSPLSVGEAVVNAGFDILSCAGNHALDRGTYGIDTTVDFCEKAGIICTGIQKSTDKEYRPYEVVTVKGMKIAVFDYTYGTNLGDPLDKYPCLIHFLPSDNEEEAFVKELRSCREEVDASVAFVHWGEEYEQEPSEYQKHMAALFAEGDVDVVIGTHPHVIQPVEAITRQDGGQTIIFYSLGNFRADQGEKEETKVGGEAHITFSRGYDGVYVSDFELEEINSYWEDLLKNQ